MAEVQPSPVQACRFKRSHAPTSHPSRAKTLGSDRAPIPNMSASSRPKGRGGRGPAFQAGWCQCRGTAAAQCTMDLGPPPKCIKLHSPHAEWQSPAVRPQGVPAGCTELLAADVGITLPGAPTPEAEEATTSICCAFSSLAVVPADKGTTSTKPPSTLETEGGGGGGGSCRGRSGAALPPTVACRRSGASSPESLPSISQRCNWSLNEWQSQPRGH